MRMVVRRLAMAALTVWLVSVGAFLMVHAGGGDPVSASLASSGGAIDPAAAGRLREELGLDRPLVVRYWQWAWGMFRLDPGTSLATGRDVTAEIGPRLLLTVKVAISAIVLSGLAGFAAALFATWSNGGWADRAIVAATASGLSIPAFWVGLLALIAAAAWFGVLLGGGYYGASQSLAAQAMAIAPAATVLAIRPAALIARVARSGSAAAMSQPHVLAARARGVSRWRASSIHAFRIGALPAIPVLGLQAAYLLGGSVVIEQVFGLPGLGRALLDAVASRDYPMLQFLVVFFACAAVLCSMLADLAHAALDPRVRR